MPEATQMISYRYTTTQLARLTALAAVMAKRIGLAELPRTRAISAALDRGLDALEAEMSASAARPAAPTRARKPAPAATAPRARNERAKQARAVQRAANGCDTHGCPARGGRHKVPCALAVRA